MATIGLNISISGYTGKLVIVWKEAATPLAEAGSNRTSTLTFPVDQVFVIPNLKPVTYIAEFWQSVDGDALSSFIKSWDIDASKDAQFGETTFEYVVDRGHNNTAPISTGSLVWADPADGAGGLRDERLIGESYRVESRGTGRYRTDEITDYAGGGFDFADGITKFSSGDTVFVTVLNKSALSVTPSAADYDDINLVAANATFDNTYYRKINAANGSATILTTTFPALALVPNTKARFSTYTGSQRYWKLQLNGTETIKFLGTDRNVIYLAKDEEIEIQWKNNVAYVTHYKGWYDQVAQRILADNKTMINCLLADATEYNIADYPRLIAELKSEQIVTYTAYDQTIAVTVAGGSPITYFKNRGKFAVDNTAGKFKVPDMRNFSLRVLKFFDATTDTQRLTQAAGGMQSQQLISHTHKIDLWNEAGQHKIAGGANFEEDGDIDGLVKAQGGIEQRVDNIGQYALIRY